MQQFNASVIISEQLNRLMVNAAQELAQRAVAACAEHYKFDAEEAIGLLGLNNVKLERKNAVVNEDEKKANNPKPKFPLPYNGEFNNDCCYALRPNNGLYTQCSASRNEAQFCKSCVAQMQKTGSDMPEYGTIQQRQAVGIFEYVDPKGRKPLSYTKVMKKYKLTQDQVLEEAGKFNVSIDNNHFIIVEEEKKRGRRPTKNDDKKEKEKGVKGRPKKVKSVIQIEGDDDDEDLFATLVEEANAEANAEEEVPTKEEKLSDDENEANELERIEREAIKERERVEREAKKEQERLEREAKKKAEEEAKAEKAAKKEQERLEREAKKKAEEDAKAEKAAKKEQERLEREAKKKEEDAKKQSKKKIEVEEEEEEEEEPDIVKKIEQDGKKYLKSKKTGIVYDYKKYVSEGEQIKVGKWNETTNKIDFEDDEESEEEYDE